MRHDVLFQRLHHRSITVHWQLPFSAVLHHCCNEHNYKLWTLLQFLLDDMSQLGICQ